MAAFRLLIDLGNDAMRTGDDVAEALQEVAQLVVAYEGPLVEDTIGSIRDANGNSVGAWKVAAE